MAGNIQMMAGDGQARGVGMATAGPNARAPVPVVT
jgi:hypothetical protein